MVELARRSSVRIFYKEVRTTLTSIGMGKSKERGPKDPLQLAHAFALRMQWPIALIRTQAEGYPHPFSAAICHEVLEEEARKRKLNSANELIQTIEDIKEQLKDILPENTWDIYQLR